MAPSRSTDQAPAPDGELFDGSATLTLLVHGLGGAAQDWRERDGYTHGGNLTDALSTARQSWIACDLYGHGTWTADEPDFDPYDIDDDTWDAFVERSCGALAAAVDRALAAAPGAAVRIVTYSAGCLMAARLLRQQPSLAPAVVVLAAVTPERAEDDEYSLHHNLEPLSRGSLALLYGERDEQTPAEDVQWLASQMTTQPRLLAYDSGHSLPARWVEDAIAVLGGE